jgi:hypothetical protein
MKRDFVLSGRKMRGKSVGDWPDVLNLRGKVKKVGSFSAQLIRQHMQSREKHSSQRLLRSTMRHPFVSIETLKYVPGSNHAG